MHLSLSERRRRFENGYVVICGIFAVLMVLTNVIGTKLFALFPSLMPTGFGSLSDYGPVILTTGLVTYPLTFLFTDVCSEIYGRRRANVMVTIGFVASIVMLAVVNIAVAVTPADRYWADASHQMTHGAEVLAVDGKTVTLEHIEFLSQPVADIPVMVGVKDGSGAPGFVHYHTVAQTGGGFGQPYRECTIQIQAGTVERGSTIVPAVQLTGFVPAGDTMRIKISGGSHLPAQGVLQDAQGATFNYTREANSEWIISSNHGDSQEVRPAALVNEMGAVAMQTAMVATFASPGILLMASMLAYLVAQYLDVFMYHFWKRITGGKMLWLRNNGSTWVSQLVDTITVNGIFLPLAFGMGFQATMYVIICVYIVKIIIAALDTPLIYLGVYIEKKRLGYEWEEEVPDLLSDQSEALV